MAYAPASRYASPSAQPQPQRPVVTQPGAPGRSELDAMAYGKGPMPPPASGGPPVALAPPPPPSVAPNPPPVVTAQGQNLPLPRPIAASSRPGLLNNLFRSRRPVAVAAPAAIAVPGPVAVTATVAPHDAAYRLDAGDRLRIVVFGQDGLTNSYSVDASGVVTMPLIGAVSARGCTPAELAAAITARLRAGFIREPYVAVEIEAYRPFFILGEVTAPGQYPYVPNLTAEAAVAIAGGYTPRAKRNSVSITRANQMGQARIVATPNAPLQPGDTVIVGERWF
ncbi:polysaccharide biosynthesis/export family protein [Bradyrhizobium sp. LHD-71]|nr:polysaccharide biosynthesis/export family protein [Bradyrhizobium sp. LHD-71]MDQ8730181.1 polysaccharide biosynthesis/export family protein [Bradyrhizobium sp. LHD-71]